MSTPTIKASPRIPTGPDRHNRRYLGADGELTYNTTTKKLHIHDGKTYGGEVLGEGASGSGAGEAVVYYTIEAAVGITAGMIVNVYNDAGTAKIRPADASQDGYHTHGFVLEDVTAGTMATVYFSGVNDKLTGLSIGDQYMSTTPGEPSPFPPTISGHTLQTVGLAVSATAMIFTLSDPAELG